MKMFVNIARLDIGQLLTQSVRQGHPCTLDTILVNESFRALMDQNPLVQNGTKQTTGCELHNKIVKPN